ncbi:MAG: type 4a pilus biogenesis protein PilO [Thermodesulfovibrionales bacterium]|nr:type 4a pilus biogenesis protein PilO [Thermodesulfovibrionales bacterium]
MALDLGFDPKVLKQKLRNPPKPVKIAVNVVPAVIVVALCVVLVILPKNKTINELGDAISKQEKDIAAKQSKVANLDKLKAQTELLKKELREFDEALPKEGEISTLLKQVNSLTKEADLDIISWKPSTRKQMHKSKIVYSIPVQVVLKGSYHKLGVFFSSLTQLKQIVNITSISLGSPTVTGDEVILSVNFTAVTFVAVPEAKIK